MVKFSVLLLTPVMTLAAAPPRHAADLIARAPLRFEANRGQLPGEVRFVARSAERTLALTAHDAVAGLGHGGDAVRIVPVGANPAAAPEGEGRLASYANYLIGNDRSQWRTGVEQFAAVRYRSLWNGIDMLYHGDGQRIEYDFVIAPGAEPAAVRLRFAGAGAMEIDGDGALVIRSAGGAELRQAAPFAYQDRGGVRTRVPVTYRLAGGNQVAFAVGDYDRARQLVIDPVLVATYFGGTNTDIATNAAVDGNGNLWVVGYTASVLSLAGEPFLSGRSGNLDVFVARFNTSLSGEQALQYATYIGGDGEDKPAAAIIANGFLYITGSTTSTNLPLAGGSHQAEKKGDRDAFLFTFSLTDPGVAGLWYGTYFGGDLLDYGTAIATDAAARVYIAGYATTGEGFTYAGGSAQAANRGGYDAFFAMFDTSLGTNSLRYSTFLGGTSTDVATGIAVDAQNRVHLTGYTMSNDFPATAGAYRTDYAGRGDVFYARINPAVSGLDGLEYATYIGGSDADMAQGMAMDGRGQILIAGSTFSNDFPLAGLAAQPGKSGNSDAFVLRINPGAPAEQFLTYSTYYGGTSTEVVNGLAYDAASGRLALAGYTLSGDLPSRGDALQPQTGGTIDGFLAILLFPAGGDPVLRYASYVGGAAVDVAYGVAMDARGNIYLAGSTTSRRLAAGGAFQADLSGLTDAFVARFNETATAAPAMAPACREGAVLTLLPSAAACTTDGPGGFVCSETLCNRGTAAAAEPPTVE